ncbi:hypothetical protein GCM10027030_20320 [Luteococcus sediminum]
MAHLLDSTTPMSGRHIVDGPQAEGLVGTRRACQGGWAAVPRVLAVEPSRLTSQPSSTFDALLRIMDGLDWAGDMDVERIPGPRGLAARSAALAAEVNGRDQLASGRLVLLQEDEAVPAWGADLRLVSLVQSEVTPGMAQGSTVHDVGWSWVQGSLDARRAHWGARSGTVSTVSSRTFEGLQDNPDHAEIEIRASWTPLLDDPGQLVDHLLAWQDLVRTAAGLPGSSAGVVMLGSRLGRTR